LREVMSRPNANPERTADAARGAIDELRKLLSAAQNFRGNDERCERLFQSIITTVDTSDWDNAAQSYLALVALYNSRIVPDREVSPPLRESIDGDLTRLRECLRFPANADSKTGISVRYNSPVNLRPAELREAFDALRNE